MTGWWLPCAVCTAMGAVGLMVSGPRGLDRLEPARARAVPRWLRGKPGALRLRTRVYAGSALGVLLALVVGGPNGVGIGLVAAVAALTGLGQLDTGGEAKRRERLAMDLPATLELLAAALSAGAPITTATRDVAGEAPPEVAAELRLILARIDIGAAEADAWQQSRDRPVIGACARDVARASRSGSALVACLQRHAAEGRRARRAGLEKRAKAVGVKSVMPMSVCFLPAFVLVGVVPIVAGIAFALLR